MSTSNLLSCFFLLSWLQTPGSFPGCIVFWREKKKCCAAGRWAQIWRPSSPTSFVVDKSRPIGTLTVTEVIPHDWCRRKRRQPSVTLFSTLNLSVLKDAARTQEWPLTSAGRNSTAACCPCQSLNICGWTFCQYTESKPLKSTNTVSESQLRRKQLWPNSST